jgi:hypothetical protein
MQEQFGQKIRNAEEFSRGGELSNDEGGMSKGRSRETRAQSREPEKRRLAAKSRLAIRDKRSTLFLAGSPLPAFRSLSTGLANPPTFEAAAMAEIRRRQTRRAAFLSASSPRWSSGRSVVALGIQAAQEIRRPE